MRQLVQITCTGGAGTSSGSAVTELINGKVKEVKIVYGGAPATTDVTLTDGDGKNILTVSNSGTDKNFCLKQLSQLATDGSDIANEYVEGVSANGRVTVSVAQANNNNVIKVLIDYENYY
jgi:ABC-type arginine transport system ATPase subunit